MRFYRPLGHVLARIPLRQDGSIRLTALLAGAGVFTRKQLRRAKPEVDGLQMSSSDVVSFAQDQVREIALHGYQFTVREDRAMTLAMHKPADVVTTHALEEGLRIFDLLPEWLFAEDLAPVGRLDKETTGLILLTEDGQLNQRLRHPSRGLLRHYEATLARPLDTARVQEALAQGVVLRDGHTVKPEKLQRLDGDEARWSISVGEGKYHEVRRFFAAMDSHVEALHRKAYGPVVVTGAPLDIQSTLEDGIPCCSSLSKNDLVGTAIAISDSLMRIDGDAKAHLYQSVQLDDELRMLEICAEAYL